MTVEFRRSSEFSLAELASVFTASYDGYFIPFVIDEAQLRYMIEVFDLDLSRSLVAVERERPVGLATEHSEAHEIDLREGLKVVAATRGGPEPWQRADETVANLARRGSPPRAITVDGAAAVFSEDGDRVSLLQAAGHAAGLEALAAALRSRGNVSALNFPAGEPVATALREAGAMVRLRQYEMVVPL